MAGWLDGWMIGWLDGWMSSRPTGWLDGWMAGWLDGWMAVGAGLVCSWLFAQRLLEEGPEVCNCCNMFARLMDGQIGEQTVGQTNKHGCRFTSFFLKVMSGYHSIITQWNRFSILKGIIK